MKNAVDTKKNKIKIPSSEAFCTVKQFAEMLQMHPNSILNSIKKGRLQAFRIGYGSRASYRIPLSEINRIAEMDLVKNARDK